MRTYIKFTKQNIKAIIDLYITGKQQREIAEQFNCAQTSISNILLRNKIETRVGKKIIYNEVNLEFFDKINTEASAYFLGLLYADGNVSKNLFSVSLKLKSNDQSIIEEFKKHIAPKNPIKISYGKYSYFRVNRKEICEQLISHGCTPNKSLTLKFPTTVPDELIHHFLRGYSDGDGSIYHTYDKNKNKRTTWKIISTKDFCQQTSKILQDKLSIAGSQSLASPKTNNIITTTLSIGGNKQVKAFLDWLYQDATIYLPRKYEKYLEFKNHSSSKSSSESKVDS